MHGLGRHIPAVKSVTVSNATFKCQRPERGEVRLWRGRCFENPLHDLLLGLITSCKQALSENMRVETFPLPVLRFEQAQEVLKIKVRCRGVETTQSSVPEVHADMKGTSEL